MSANAVRLAEIATLMGQIDSIEDLRTVYETYRACQDLLVRKAAIELRIGDWVKFDAGRGKGVLVGKVTRVSSKTAAVLVGRKVKGKVSGAIPVNWKVGIELLKKVTKEQAVGFELEG